MEPIAIRGSSLALARARWVDVEDANEPTTVEAWVVMEVSDGGLLRETVTFDVDDIDAAFAELEERYLAGEAAEHSHTWSVIAQAYAAFNRRELPATTPDWVNIDHRRGTGIRARRLQSPYVRAVWEVAPDVNIYIEAVHRLSNLGAVVTHAAKVDFASRASTPSGERSPF